MFFKFKKVTRQLHLWLGLASGLVVFVVAITGAIWTFESEISDLVYSYRKVEPIAGQSIINISEIKKIVKPQINKISGIAFLGYDRSIEVRERLEINGQQINNYVYLNPYSGKVLKTKLNEPNFFDVVIELHTSLLLGEVGEQIVDYATLILIILLISGIYLWWPKKKKGLKQRVKFDWKTSTKWKRKNYDLHSVLGFYASWIVIFVAITGLTWGFKWVDESIYAIATLGEEYKDYTEINSTSSLSAHKAAGLDDSILQTAIQKYGKPFESWHYYFPEKKEESISLYLNPTAGTWHKASTYFFDQRTGALLFTDNPKDFNNGQLIRNMYYDIHIGKILGLPGQLLVFFASLIVASLPITGFLLWWGRKMKAKVSMATKIQLSNTV